MLAQPLAGSRTLPPSLMRSLRAIPGGALPEQRARRRPSARHHGPRRQRDHPSRPGHWQQGRAGPARRRGGHQVRAMRQRPPRWQQASRALSAPVRSIVYDGSPSRQSEQDFVSIRAPFFESRAEFADDAATADVLAAIYRRNRCTWTSGTTASSITPCDHRARAVPGTPRAQRPSLRSCTRDSQARARGAGLRGECNEQLLRLRGRPQYNRSAGLASIVASPTRRWQPTQPDAAG